jgi:hypothetical protein
MRNVCNLPLTIDWVVMSPEPQIHSRRGDTYSSTDFSGFAPDKEIDLAGNQRTSGGELESLRTLPN